MIAVTLDEWKRKLDFPTGETVILHNPKVKPFEMNPLCVLKQTRSKAAVCDFLFFALLTANNAVSASRIAG